jgi:beta-fructofuranosidase
MLRLEHRWVWDFWLAQTRGAFHVFYLQAPKTLGHEALRHKNASIGHAVSEDLISWTVLRDAIGPGPAEEWDDLATWTGSVVEHDGSWYMLYTGVSTVDGGLVQKIGLATSPDLVIWTKHYANPVMVADTRWYEELDPTAWGEQAWRDPWLVRDPDGRGFHALITARAAQGPVDGRGVIGHATSDDLVSWTVQPPLSEPGEFGHLEVPQVEVVDGAAVFIFSVAANDVSKRRRLRQTVATATYICPGRSLLGPFDLTAAQPVAAPHLYAGRLVRRRDGSWVMLGFVDTDAEGRFVGEIGDPIPVGQLGVPGFGPGADRRDR